MPAYNETIDDFNLKWANTYALYQQKLVFVHSIEFSEDEEEPAYSALLYHSNKTKEHLTNFDLNILTPIVVNSSLFNSRPLTDLTSAVSTQDPTCLRISRRARRMNKRSLCDEQSKLSSPAMYFMSKVSYKISGNNSAFSFQKIEHLLKNEYPAYQQAFDILSGHIMLALSSDFAIMASHIDSDQCLFASQWGFIGTATPTEIIVHHKPSYQEVCDFVRRKHLEVSVKCH